MNNMEKNPTEVLEKLVPIFYHNDQEAKAYGKIAEGYKSEIKDTMIENELQQFEVGELKASCTESIKEDFIEDKLIDCIKDLGIKGIVKKKEYVDMEALENAIYHGKIDAACLNPCRVQKSVWTLRVSKMRGKKDG